MGESRHSVSHTVFNLHIGIAVFEQHPILQGQGQREVFFLLQIPLRIHTAVDTGISSANFFGLQQSHVKLRWQPPTLRMEPGTVPNRQPAPYGQACVSCARAKCKCIGRIDSTDHTCERCHRLGRQCQRPPPLRKRPVKRPPKNVSQLEEKLDDLVTLLKAQAQSGVAPGTTTAPREDLGGLNALQFA